MSPWTGLLLQVRGSTNGEDGVAGSIPAGGSTTTPQLRPGATPGLRRRQGCDSRAACHLRAMRPHPAQQALDTDRILWLQHSVNLGVLPIGRT
jgi:hypothetical protein